jgi:hypothetical protein
MILQKKIFIYSILFILLLNSSNCGTITTKIQSPLPIKNLGISSEENVMLHIPEASRAYIWKGEINVIDYHVEFGNALEPNAKYALSKYFKDVTIIDKPMSASKSMNITNTVTMEIETASVNPGSLTFTSTESEIKIKTILTKDGKADGNDFSVLGRGSASPGILGLIPIINQIAYNNALQNASERAMTNALEKIMDEIIKRKGKK